jgi:hypothetical protein
VVRLWRVAAWSAGVVVGLSMCGCDREPPKFPSDANVVVQVHSGEPVTLPPSVAAVVVEILNRPPDSYVRRADLTATAAELSFVVANVGVEYFGSLSLRDERKGSLRGRWYWTDPRLDPLWQHLMQHYDEPLEAVRIWSDELAASSRE